MDEQKPTGKIKNQKLPLRLRIGTYEYSGLVLTIMLIIAILLSIGLIVTYTWVSICMVQCGPPYSP